MLGAKRSSLKDDTSSAHKTRGVTIRDDLPNPNAFSARKVSAIVDPAQKQLNIVGITTGGGNSSLESSREGGGSVHQGQTKKFVIYDKA